VPDEVRPGLLIATAFGETSVAFLSALDPVRVTWRTRAHDAAIERAKVRIRDELRLAGVRHSALDADYGNKLFWHLDPLDVDKGVVAEHVLQLPENRDIAAVVAVFDHTNDLPLAEKTEMRGHDGSVPVYRIYVGNALDAELSRLGSDRLFRVPNKGDGFLHVLEQVLAQIDSQKSLI
jgi:hydroxymethylpyrimidine pyrophosphatase-like HAD family hydrolase